MVFYLQEFPQSCSAKFAFHLFTLVLSGHSGRPPLLFFPARSPPGSSFPSPFGTVVVTVYS